MTTWGLGLRVKSGYAIAVAMAGSAAAPRIVARLRLELSDPAAPETRQPFHRGFFTQEDDPREIARRTRIVTSCAARSVAALLQDARVADRRCRGAGLVVGSVIDPARVGNLHIRAHASEGQLFRTVLLDALGARGIACAVIVDKTLAAEAAKRLCRSNAAIAGTIAALGKAVTGGWRADDKAACTAAWIALS